MNDLLEVKFYENKINGQSKGFCLCTVGSDASFRIVMDKLPKLEVNGQAPICTHFSRHFFNQFEEQARKDMASSAAGQGGQANGGSSLDSQYHHSQHHHFNSGQQQANASGGVQQQPFMSMLFKLNVILGGKRKSNQKSFFLFFVYSCFPTFLCLKYRFFLLFWSEIALFWQIYVKFDRSHFGLNSILT